MVSFLFQKIERLKSSLHLIDCDDKPKNKHTIFVDSKKEGMYSIRAVLLKKTTTTFTVMINPIHPRINTPSLLTQRREVCIQLELN